MKLRKLKHRPKKDYKNICPNCGEKGPHWVNTGNYFIGNSGFWTCSKMYDENGRRKEEHNSLPSISSTLSAFYDALAAIDVGAI